VQYLILIAFNDKGSDHGDDTYYLVMPITAELVETIDRRQKRLAEQKEVDGELATMRYKVLGPYGVIDHGEMHMLMENRGLDEEDLKDFMDDLSNDYTITDEDFASECLPDGKVGVEMEINATVSIFWHVWRNAFRGIAAVDKGALPMPQGTFRGDIPSNSS
jgi:hypothetical protein